MRLLRPLCLLLLLGLCLPPLPGRAGAPQAFAGLAFGTPIDLCQEPLEALTEVPFRPDGEGNLWSKDPWATGPVRFPVSVFAGGRLETGGLEELRLDAEGFLSAAPEGDQEATPTQVLTEFLRLAGAYAGETGAPPLAFVGLQAIPGRPPEPFGPQAYGRLDLETLLDLYGDASGQLCCKLLFGNRLLCLSMGAEGPFETYRLSLAYLDADRTERWTHSRYFAPSDAAGE